MGDQPIWPCLMGSVAAEAMMAAKAAVSSRKVTITDSVTVGLGPPAGLRLGCE